MNPKLAEGTLVREPAERWTVADAAELYDVERWGKSYFSVGGQGHLLVHPTKEPERFIDLKQLVDTLLLRGISLPILIRFAEILKNSLAEIRDAFQRAITEHGYQGSYCCAYPIKVNQQRQVVEEVLNFGRPYRFGLEAGSKPELLAGLALLDNPDALLVLNGYKDVEYMETALLAQKLGRHPIIVIDRYRELDRLLTIAERLGVRPMIGVRAKLTTRGAGKWMESTGDRSKFGLTATEMVMLVDRLRERGMLDCLELLHFHIGSQISNVRAIKDAMKEGSRIFVELSRAGAGMRYIDVGGGLGVDYDGSSTSWTSSVNYTMQEYANDVVAAIQQACDEYQVAHPHIVSESGRALVAHHSVLVFDILDVDCLLPGQVAPREAETQEEHSVIQSLAETWRSVSRKNFQEAYHDALQLKEEATGLFNMGLLDLGERARVEQLFWGCCEAILKIIRDLDYVPDDLEGLEKGLADTYYGNFSVFQSAPDHWAVKQLFPTIPIHRLNERPTRRGVIADLTCDSDGKMDQFIDLRDVKNCLELHPSNGERYLLATFLIGAYQEILGDLHNLFGDTNTVHVSLDETGYRIDHVVEGDTVTDVLGYVEFRKHDLVEKMRQATEQAVREGRLTLEDSALLISRYDQGLRGYTYLREMQEGEFASAVATLRSAPRVVETPPNGGEATTARAVGQNGT